MLNVTAVGATQPTFLTVWPDGPLPLASSLNPVPGQPPTPNAVTTDLDAAGEFKVYNLQGNVDVIIDINGYYTEASLQELLDRIEAIENSASAISAMSLVTIDGKPTVRFSGVNVQVVDGSDDTGGTTNGLGNLIVGYNEDAGTDGADTRTGSHNVVIGNEHSYTSFGGFLAGLNNTTSARFASVSGGVGNTASGPW